MPDPATDNPVDPTPAAVPVVPGRARAALEAFLQAWDVLDQALTGDDVDPAEAWGQGNRLAELVRDRAAETRAGIARRVQERERLSLAHLGNRFGVSKARAAQILNRRTAVTAAPTPREE